jgi:hypothetical protein
MHFQLGTAKAREKLEMKFKTKAVFLLAVTLSARQTTGYEFIKQIDTGMGYQYFNRNGR